MSDATDIRTWRTVLVYGLGVSGRAAAGLALSRGQRVRGVDDDPNVDIGDLAGRVEVTTADELADDIDGVVVSPGVPSEAPLLDLAAERALPVVSEVEFAYQWSDSGVFVGITGSNGKSTTTALAGDILAADGGRVAVCGNFGLALSEAVAEGAETYVVELSSFQLEATRSFHPHVAAWLNLTADHLDRHATLAAYAEAKASIFHHQTAADFAILNADDAVVSTTESRAGRLTFSTRRPVHRGCYLEQDAVVEVDDRGGRVLFSADDLSLPGLHNLQNAMAAALIGRSLGVEQPTIRKAIRGFRGLPHRMELVADIDGVRFYNDSKGTNPAAAARSLAAFADGGVHLIVGGRAKGSDWSELAAAAVGRVRRVYGVGEAGAGLVKALAPSVPGEDCSDLASAVHSAAAVAQRGDVVLLSPACASYDQYESFAQRGDHFRQLVHELAGVDAPEEANG